MIAVYPGSFNPFTKGHQHVFDEAMKLFDKVIILFVTNPMKPDNGAGNYRATKLLDQFRQHSKYSPMDYGIEHWEGLTADYCKKYEINYLIRGLRGTSDYLYEEEVAKANEEIYPEIKTIYFRAKDDAISSSLVRLLESHGKDVSKYLPSF